MKKHARQMFIRANARIKKHTECITEYSCGELRLVAFESCRRRDAYFLWNISLQYWCENVQKYKLLQRSQRIDRSDAE